MKSLLSLSLWAATAVAKTGLLIPFYEYPNDASKAEWDALIAAVDTYPNLDFYVIINNQGGAPYGGANPPDSIKDWAQRLGQLNDPKRTNSHPIGYVYTSQSARIYAEIARGIDQYANWTKAAGWDGADHDIHVEGIFFDEVDTTKLKATEAFATYAKSIFQGHGGPIVLNPGGPVAAGSESLFEIADSIVQMETCYTTVDGATYPDGKPRCPKGGYVPFTKASLDTLGANVERIAKSSLLVHDFYDSWNPYQPAPLSALEEDVKAIVDRAVHSFYIAQHEWQGGFNSEPASISNVARLAAAAQDLSWPPCLSVTLKVSAGMVVKD